MIFGGDQLPKLRRWKYIEEILKIAKFIVVNRPGQSKKIKGIPYIPVTVPGIDLSSSDVRRRIVEGKTIKYLVPDRVIDYIKENRLYQRKSKERG